MASDIRKQLFEIKRIHEVNMTSLMDITFILLLVFIVTFPMVEQSTPVKLPSGTGSPLKADQCVAVTLDAETRVFWDGRSVTVPELQEAARQLHADKPETTVLLRGDQGIAYGKIMDIFQALQQAGLTKVALVTQAPPPKKLKP